MEPLSFHALLGFKPVKPVSRSVKTIWTFKSILHNTNLYPFHYLYTSVECASLHSIDWSPIQVLTGLNAAELKGLDGNCYVEHRTAVG